MPNIKTEIIIDVAEVDEKVGRLLEARTQFFEAVKVLDRWYIGDMISVQITDKDETANVKTEIVINVAEVNEKIDRLLKARAEFIDAASALDKVYVGDVVGIRIIDKKDETASGNWRLGF
ncbi:MAG: hypothetical protein AB9883_07670 [Acidaminococcaceae bacterium]